jgi:FixJ family two-component response regulator
MKDERTVWIVDDDADVLQAIDMQLRTVGLTTIPCRSGPELLQVLDPERPGCILLDLRMPQMNGIEVQRELARRGDPHPIVFLTGHGDVPMAVQALKAGAVDFLEKPARLARLLEALERALDLDREARQARGRERRLRELRDSLSRRESEVASLLLEGLRTAEIAERLQLSRRTAEMHRARLFKRIGARTTADAARLLQQIFALPDEDQKNP